MSVVASAPQSEPHAGGPRRVLVPVAAALIALVLAGVAGEVLTRAFGILDRLNGYSRLLFVAAPAEGLPFGLRPGVETTFLGIPVRVNGDGCRGPDRARDAGQRARVLLLGDSVVFGMGVGEEEAVGARLAARLGDGDVVACGVPGFDGAAEAAQLARLAPRLRPEVVVVGMSLNDYDPAPRFHPLGLLSRTAVPSGFVNDLLGRSELVLLLRWVAAWMRGGLWQQTVEHTPAATEANDALHGGLDRLVGAEHSRFYANPTPDAWARVRAGLIELRRAAAAADTDLLVAIFPESWQVGVPSPNLEPQRKLLRLCAETQVRCLDLAPAFLAAHDGALFVDAQHPNARGHDVAAEALAAALQRPS